MRLEVEIIINDLADQDEIDSVMGDICNLLKHHTPWISCPEGLPEMTGISPTGIVAQWRFPSEDDDEWYT